MLEARFTEPITLVLSKEVHAKIMELCNAKRVSMAAVVRELLSDSLYQQGSMKEVEKKR